MAAVIGALLPDNAIVSDESITAGIHLSGATEGAPPHDWLSLTGNSIGQGLPLATGAAVACPDRPVLALQADGSAMYTIQALWTQAREGLDVTTVIYDNRSYAILNLELNRVGAEAGGEGRGRCSTSARPTSTSWRSPRGSAYLRSVWRRPTSSRRRFRRHSKMTGLVSSTPCFPGELSELGEGPEPST